MSTAISRHLHSTTPRKSNADLQALTRMICYVGAAQNEKQAHNAIKKYGKWTHPDPANPAVDVVWNGAVAMIAGCKLIVGYQNSTDTFGNPIRIPVYHSLYWMNLLSPVPDDMLYNDVANVARAPIIEFDFTLRVTRRPISCGARRTCRRSYCRWMTRFSASLRSGLAAPIWVGFTTP